MMHGATTPATVAFEAFTYTGRDALFERPLPEGHFRNPVLTGFFPDPSICRVGEDYYLVTSTFAFFPGIPVLHSRDLVNWRQIGNVVHRPDQLKFDGLAATRGIFAPAITHHNGTFYLTCTMVGAGGNFLMTATDPAGPWSDPIWYDFEGIDPSLFFDDDGRAWMLNNGAPIGTPLYDGHRAIWIQEFDVATKKLIGPRTQLINGGVDITTKPVWIEGPHLYRRGEWYYLCCAEGGTSVHHSQVIYRGKSPTGPFTPWEGNPILTQRDLDPTAPDAITCTGHVDMEIGPDGNWWAIFLACRPYGGNFWTTGRETFLLPVTWTEDGWPQILPSGERVPLTLPAPKAAMDSPQDSAGTPMLPGNFTWRDEFDGTALGFEWLRLRTSPESWSRLEGGALHLTPKPDTLAGTDTPAFLGRRVQHASFDATLTVQVPDESRVTAGLAAFQNEAQHLYVGVRRNGDWMSVFVEMIHEGKRSLVANEVMKAAPTVDLSLSVREKTYSVSAHPAGESPRRLVHDQDSYPLTVQAAGGGLHFTGLVVGPHARRGR
jgi:alpha-N-arabinofuranosidase